MIILNLLSCLCVCFLVTADLTTKILVQVYLESLGCGFSCLFVFIFCFGVSVCLDFLFCGFGFCLFLNFSFSSH